MDKLKLKQLIQLNRELGGTITKGYLSISKIETPEECYSIYYAGGCELSIGVRYTNHYSKLNNEMVTDINIDTIVDEVFLALEGNVWPVLEQALVNIGTDGEWENLKYFDRDLDLHSRFKSEVVRLMSIKK